MLTLLFSTLSFIAGFWLARYLEDWIDRAKSAWKFAKFVRSKLADLEHPTTLWQQLTFAWNDFKNPAKVVEIGTYKFVKEDV